jgi:hypothetical protein
VTEITGRHPGTVHLVSTLKANPNLPGAALGVAQEIEKLTGIMVGGLQDGPELTAGLRKLREAKDCFVLQALVDSGKFS